MRPSEFVNRNREWDNNRMVNFEINGKTIKTNYGANKYPYLKDYYGFSRISWRKGMSEVFDELVEKGYTYIRFEVTTTAIRGFHNVYVKATK